MANRFSDIEEFTIEELRAEILRREQAAQERRCWYCGRNIAEHTCKFSHVARLPAPG